LRGGFNAFLTTRSRPLRLKDNRQHRAAFFELYLHELLLRQGVTVECHPKMPPGVDTHPDFLVNRDDAPVFYLEATLASETDEENNARRVVEDAYDALNRMDSPDFFLAIQVHGQPRSPVPVRKGLRKELEKWIRGLDYESLASLAEEHGVSSLPEFTWEHDGWKVLFRAVPKKQGARGKPGVRPLGAISQGEAWFAHTDESIAQAVIGKAGKYGVPPLPYIVAVNVLDESGVDLDDIFLGLARVWGTEEAPLNTRVSAVLVAEVSNARSAVSETPRLIHNRLAERPLSESEWAMPQWRLEARGFGRVVRPARSASDVLGVTTSSRL
jgi:hypothetical protein